MHVFARALQVRNAHANLCALEDAKYGEESGQHSRLDRKIWAAYPYFIILDADSIMSADALLRLARAMDQNPRAGLIQTVPRLAGGVSLFARLQQFAACYYGQILAAGLAAWHGHGGNYWGHNAIIRTAAFASSAGLPQLPGKPPLGGHILSHDFVEAALLRRAGWEVHMVPSLEGSYEGCPPTLADLITRDRRWAQGNLQHLRLLGARGLPFLSRVHLAMGAFAYLASPLWALTLIVGVILAFQAKYATPSYFGTEASLFPKWPVFDAQVALALFLATVIVVHLPKLLGAVWALRTTGHRQRNGGIARVAGGVLLELIVSTLMAPILMITQTSAVLSILLGRDAGWGAQRRVGAGATLLQFAQQHRWHIAWGATGAGMCWAISLAVFAWMSPHYSRAAVGSADLVHHRTTTHPANSSLARNGHRAPNPASPGKPCVVRKRAANLSRRASSTGRVIMSRLCPLLAYSGLTW